MVSIAKDFSKVYFKDDGNNKFEAKRQDGNTVEVKSQTDSKIEKQTVNKFRSDMSKGDNKIISLEKSPKYDTVEFKTNKKDDPNTLSQDKLDNLDKKTEKNQESYRKYSMKNDEASLKVKAKWFGRQGISGNIGESNVDVTMKPNFFNAKKGKITGTIDGQPVNIPFSYDENNNLCFGDKENNISDTIKNNLGLIVDNNVKTIETRNKALLLAMAAHHGSNMQQQQMMNDQINLQNQLFQQQMFQDQMIHQQMHQQAINNHMMSMGMM